MIRLYHPLFGSRPVRARGLKRCDVLVAGTNAMSRPVRARGLKPNQGFVLGLLLASRPVRARGLKLITRKSAF